MYQLDFLASIYSLNNSNIWHFVYFYYISLFLIVSFTDCKKRLYSTELKILDDILEISKCPKHRHPRKLIAAKCQGF